MKSIVLTAGTEHVRYRELAHLIADALWPEAGPNGERFRYGAARVNLDAELKRAVKSRALPVKDPLTLGPHTFPIVDALNRALVSVDDLREFVAGRGLNVLFQFTIDEDGGTTSFIATQAQYDDMVAERKAKREARHALNRYTMYEAAEVLSTVNGRDAKAFLEERMVPAANDGELVVVDPVDWGPVMDRPCRPYDDWTTPAHINDWLTRAPFLEHLRWPIAVTAPQAAPVVTPEPQALPVVAGGKKWTPEKLAELKTYREGHTMPETAEKFGISEQRIRDLLPSNKSKATPFDGLIQRTK